jgi:hypothetical protein
LWCGAALAAGAPAVGLGQVASVEVVPAKATVTAGEQIAFTVKARDSLGAEVKSAGVIWLIGPFGVASVDQTGLVRTYRQGTSRVLARVGGKVASAELTVLPKPPVRLEVTAEPRELVPGGMALVRAVPYTEDAEPMHSHPVRFQSSAPRVATVDASGAVVARAPGEATIVVEAGRGRAEVRIRVVPNSVARLEVTGPTTARTGDVIRFAAQGLDAQGRPVADPPVRWAVSGGGATIYPDGGFVAERPGTYAVSAMVGTVTSSAAVEVTKRVHDRELQTVQR